MEQPSHSQSIPRRRESDRLSDQTLQGKDLKELIEIRNGLIIAQDADHTTSKEYWVQNAETGQTGKMANETVAEAPSAEQRIKKESREKSILSVGDRIGHGGFGDVYKGEITDERTARSICIKQAKYMGYEALINENTVFNLLLKKPHDNIIERIFLAQCDEIAILGLEYIPGQNLSEIVYLCRKKGAAFPRSHLIHILMQQNSAIQFLREQEIMHCDIKPENIIYNMKTNKSKLIDFGLAMHQRGLSDTLVKRTGGTTEFMAIETLMDHELHVKSDVYGLGTTLYNLMMLETPWHFLPTIQDLYAKKTEPTDPNHKQEKEKRRADVRIAIMQELSDFRQHRNEANQNPNQPTDTQVYHQTILQENFRRHHVNHLEQLCAVSHIVYGMLSHDSHTRPGCEDIATHIATYIEPESRSLAQQMTRISLKSQSSSGSDGSNSPVTPAPTMDSETLRAGPVPIVIHHSSSEPEDSSCNSEWVPGSADDLPNLGVMVESSQSHMSVQSAQTTESSRNYSSVEMRSEQSVPSSVSTNQPQQSESGDAMNDYLDRHSQPSYTESQINSADDGAGDHNYQGRMQPQPDGEFELDLTGEDGYYPLTISSAGSMMRFDSRPTQPVEDNLNPGLSGPPSNPADDDSRNNTALTQPASTDNLQTYEPVESSLIETEQVDFDPDLDLTQEDSRQVYDGSTTDAHEELGKRISNPLSPPTLTYAAQDDGDDDL